MALNIFKVRKYATLLFVPLISVVLYAIGGIYYGLVGGLLFMGIGTILGVIIGVVLLSNPFTAMLEGKGILTLAIDSTGVIRPFIVSVQSPYIFGKLGKKEVNDVFDRSATSHFAVPKKIKNGAKPKEDGGIHIDIGEKEFNEGRFAMFHYPVLIYNEQINSIITKDFLSEKEKDAFAEHGVLYLNRKMEELTSAMRDFGRYVVETIKPQQSIFKNKWFWIILVGFLIFIGILFAPAIIKALQGFGGTVSGAVSTAGNSGGSIVPR